MASNIPGGPNTTEGEFNQSTYVTSNGATNVSNLPSGSIPGGNISGSSSNSAGWVPDILSILQEAHEMAGVDFTTSYALRSAKRSIDYLALEFQNIGLNLWCLVFESIVLTPGNAGPYLLPVDTMDVITPSIRTFISPGPRYTVGGTNGNPPTVQTVDQANCIDILMAREDFSSYISIPDKAAQGRPITVFFQRLQLQPQCYVWLNPSSFPGSDIWTLVYYKLRRMQNSGTATNLLDLPSRFIPAFTKGIAWQLAVKAVNKNFNLIQMLKMDYKECLLMACREDRDRSPIYLSPCGYGSEGGYGGGSCSAL